MPDRDRLSTSAAAAAAAAAAARSALRLSAGGWWLRGMVAWMGATVAGAGASAVSFLRTRRHCGVSTKAMASPPPSPQLHSTKVGPGSALTNVPFSLPTWNWKGK